MQRKNFISSLGFAIKGIKAFFSLELHAIYHSVAAVAVIVAGIILGVNRYEWALLIIAISLVFICEMLNTTIEWIMNLLHPQHHKKAAMIKDLAAGFVLFSSFMAVILGIIVFYPYIF